MTTIVMGSAPGSYGGTDALSLRRDFSLNPSMSPSALSTAILNAVNSAISASRPLSIGWDQWPLDAPLVIDGPLPGLIGAGVMETWNSYATTFYMPLTAAGIAGAALVQTQAGADILQITTAGSTVNLSDFGLIL